MRLSLITREARTQGRGDVLALARALRTEVERVEVGDGEAIDPKATRALFSHVPKIDALQRDLGLADHGMSVYPKWLRFAAWSSPAVLGLGLLGWIIERRRKKKEIGKAEMERLERSESQE